MAKLFHPATMAALPIAFVLSAAAMRAPAADGVAATQPSSQPSTQPATQPREPVAGMCRPCHPEGATLTDDWFGFGKTLSEKGIDLSLGLTQIYQQNLHGGMSTHRRAGRYAGSYDLDARMNLERLVGITGGSFYVLARGGWSDGADALSVESLFGANADAIGDLPIDVWQMYYEQDFFDQRVRIRVGRIDLTGAFECRSCRVAFDGSAFANDETSQFLNGALVNNPTIPFPEPGMAVIAYVEPVDGWYVSAAVADADAKVTTTGFDTAFHGPADTFSICETGIMPELPSANGELQGNYRAGFWYDPRAKDRLDGEGVRRDDVGFYTSCDQMLWKEGGPEQDSGQGLGGFGRYGIADARVNEVKSFWSTGLQYQGLIPGRDSDVLAVGVGQGRLSRAAGFGADSETALETFYNIAVTPWFHVAPDIQYIWNPGGDPTTPGAVVLGVRAQIQF